MADKYYEIAVTTGAAVVAGNNANVLDDRSAQVQIQCDQAMRVRNDGVSPTSTVGWQVAPGSPIPFVMTEAEFKASRWIAESANGVIRVMPYRPLSR